MSDTSAAEPSADTTPKPRSVDAHDFPDELRAAVAESDLVLVDFYTNGCSICKSIEPVLGGVARNATVPILLVNPRDDPPLVSEHAIRSVPTLALFEAGDDGEPVEVDRLAEGFVGADELVEFVESHR
ncbi:thioredoxin family protein [Halobaculum rubrum]|uniref:thioredoxin family protein n=1 Tax=Halobaculum rubrum TaxID=2872158 RepID=UPI001CA406E9|nr:thioredoxin family protein [Halobaculum rubrum]QZX99744.1 thioredoxin family protein [Halobaculum rubrum]